MKKIVIVGLVFLFIVISTTTVYAYSEFRNDNYLNEPSQVIVIKDSMSSMDNKSLIPLGSILGVNDTYYVDYYYEVEVLSELDFETVISNIRLLNGNEFENDNNLFNFDISYQVMSEFDNTVKLLLSNDDSMTYLVKISVSMNEPTSYEQYLEVVSSKLQFDVEFKALA